MQGSGQPEPASNPERSPVDTEEWAKYDDSLGQLLEVAEHQAGEENDRRASLTLQAGWLIGFAGVILALSGALVQKVLEDGPDLGRFWRFWAAGSLLISIVAVVFAIGLGTWTVLRPPKGAYIDTTDLKTFATRDKYGRPRGKIRNDQIELLVAQIEQDRDAFKTRSKRVKVGYTLLAVALGFLLLHELAYIYRATLDYPCPTTAAAQYDVVPSHSQVAYAAFEVGARDTVPPALATKVTDLQPRPRVRQPGGFPLLVDATPTPTPTPSSSGFCITLGPKP